MVQVLCVERAQDNIIDNDGHHIISYHHHHHKDRHRHTHCIALYHHTATATSLSSFFLNDEMRIMIAADAQ